MKKILLTGGSGFIGRNIVEQLGGKYKIIAPSRDNVDFTDQWSVDIFFQRLGKLDTIIHAAGKASNRDVKDQAGIFYADMRMLLNLLRHEDSFKRMIILSSGAVYNLKNKISKAKEIDYNRQLPDDEHALYRFVCAKFAETNKKIVDLRIFGIFGKYENYAIRFISNAICRSLCGLPIFLKQNRVFDYIYVNDLMPVLRYFIENLPKHSSYNITSGQSVELLDLAKIVQTIAGNKTKIKVHRPGLGLEYSGNNSRLRKEIKGLEFTQLFNAIEELFAWYANNQRLINKKLLLFDEQN